MPAYFETGFSVRQPMWHGQGMILGEYPEDWVTARKHAGLTWEPVEHPSWVMRGIDDFTICTRCSATMADEGKHTDDCDLKGTVLTKHVLPEGSYITDGGLHVFTVDPDHKQVIRSDTKRVLGSGLSSDYALVTHGHQSGFASMEQIVDAFKDLGVKFETAGSVRDGKAVWALLYLDEPFTIKGDKTEHMPFIALLNRHDGTGACKVVSTTVRVVCWNTFQMAEAQADKTGQSFTFRHSGDVETRIDEATDALKGIRQDTKDYVEMANELTKLNVTDAHLGAFISEFLPSPRENGEQCSDRVHGNVENARTLFKHLYNDSITTESIRGTAFGLLHASTEYLDHARAYRSQDSYMGRSILRAEPAKARAMNIIREVCKA